MKKHIRMQIVAGNLKKYRLKNGWTQEELAEQAEVSHAFVNQIENCKRDMTLGYCHQICNALNITPNDLLVSESEMEDSKKQVDCFSQLMKEMEISEIYFLLYRKVRYLLDS